MKRTTFNVKGMHCKSCELILKESLEEQPGVKVIEAKADAAQNKGQVSVVFNEKSADEKMLKELIEKEGYKVI